MIDTMPEDPRARSAVLGNLRAGQPVLSLGVRSARTADIARLARSAGYRVIWVDLEHSSMSIDCASQILASAFDLGLEAWVRVPEKDYGAIGRLLDGGATGIIMPRVESAEEAARVVTAARFPPRGQRSQIARLPQFCFERLPAAELMEWADRLTSVHILLETATGIANVDAIAAVDGVDILHVGLNDLSVDLGHTGGLRHPDVLAACKQVASAAARHGKLAAVGGVADPEHYRDLLDIGVVPLIFAGIDAEILAAGIAQRAEHWRARSEKTTS
ncbi:MAG TPA: aldolase/citrate lyase family protein [Steroidobacteraceae bacterium]|nr:aldolase/citrate lyase family protein [Steroidobacteraceae bacterium]